MPRIQRITIILFLIVVTNWAMVKFTGYSLMGGDLFTVFLIVFLILLVLSLIGPLVGKLFTRH